VTQRRPRRPKSPTISPTQLRDAATMARHLDDFLGKCIEQDVLFLMGFDLDYLARQFEGAARKMEDQP
jgi:hypothetical protein